ncbi:centromere/kinetochore protein zw10 [Capsaspora owczarzaki ATCC 30864]|uniref:Centromere/kinetochore protein zw10 n=1 Tax=Capsaspora owczarzaki (strain ATCC 30864) TaxID=595528 RepID=A0A0D2WI78_CAPO3|nr:centromere/kinetochore protein zw10 [Capsaspora owczarzaki ATCC 30864]KJE88618.1 centromere/kinetochore protein zw10 [Capsaspora owczarzaki ATCC 30864]|eukprot:XP_004365116.1 centromere/kinetochore protein zw10 [Capsaspora owczarzaki ATCC 30864]
MAALRQVQLQLQDDALGSREGIEAGVAALQRKMDEVKGQVYETVNKHYREFVQAFDYALDLNGEVAGLAQQLQAVNNLANDASVGVLNKLHTATERHVALTRKLKDADCIISVLERLCRIHDDLTGMDGLMERSLFPQAALSVHRINALLSELNPEDQFGCDAKIFAVIRAESRRKRTAVKSHLETLWSTSVRLATAHHAEGASELVVVLTDNNKPVHLQPALQAMHSLAMLESKMDVFCKALMQQFISPLLANDTPLAPTVTKFKGVVSLTLMAPRDDVPSPAAADVSGRLSVTQLRLILENVATVIEFVNTHAFPKKSAVLAQDNGQDENAPASRRRDLVAEELDAADLADLALLFGAHLWPVLHQAIINELLSAAIPKRSDETEVFAAVSRLAHEFEAKMVDFGLLEVGQHELLVFAQNIHNHFAAKKRQDVLAAARSCMLSEDHNSVVCNSSAERGGAGSAAFPTTAVMADAALQPATDGSERPVTFDFPDCQITQRTRKIVDMAYDMLEEVTTSSPAIAVHLFVAVRDMFDLYRAVVPVHHGATFERVPMLGMLFHNDCMFIAHHLITLGIQFKSRLPPPMNATATFVDMVVPFRQLGERFFVHQMDLQRDLLIEAIVSANGFKQTHLPEKKAVVEKAIKQVLLQLTHLSKVWKNVLPLTLFNQTMAHLIEAAMGKIISDILAISDIGEDETHELVGIISLVVQRAETLLVLDAAVPARASTLVARTSAPKTNPAIRSLVPSWSKFVQLGEILNMSLAEITERWIAGTAASAPGSVNAAAGWLFQPQELAHLIRALFSDTPLRHKTLALFK